ncbi:hypothetical protein NL108_012278 [Boleophthalmus pectinirostris]|nr:hypothetical protein NL108_012278 [Boleophthalmus pectinirostris]
MTNKHLRCSFFSGKGFFLRAIFHIQNISLSCGHIQSFWITSLQTKGLRGIYTSMQKYREGSQNCLPLPAEPQGGTPLCSFIKTVKLSSSAFSIHLPRLRKDRRGRG